MAKTKTEQSNRANVESAYERYKRFLPRVINLELMTLKGHLLIEEGLQHFIEGACTHPESLADARFTFSQKLHLVKALTGSLIAREFRFIVGLNTLRNKLSHQLEPGWDVAEMVNNLMKEYWKGEFQRPISAWQRAARFRQTLAFILGTLSGYALGRELFKRD